MAARRSNKRKRRNRGRLGGLYKLLSILIILAVVAAGCIVFFRVNQVTAVGQARYSAQEIIDASGVQEGDNLLLLNRGAAVKGILSRLPYVESVNLRRELPDRVVITVEECVPTALIQGEGSWWVLDANGKILEQTTRSGWPELTRVAGMAAVGPAAGAKLEVSAQDVLRLDSLVQIMQALTDRDMMEKVSVIDLTGPGDVTMEYDGRFTVRLPLNADFARKMIALEGTVAQLQPNEKGKIDLTREDRAYFDPN